MQAWDSYWQNNNPNTPVFSDHLGQNRAEIGEFWTSVFSNLTKTAAVLDIACGAGAVYDAIDDIDAFTLYAHDGSPVARSKLLSKYPCVSEVSNESLLQLNKPFIDQLVSQFGIEYLGDNHREAAFNTLQVGGNFAALVHAKGGYIYSKYKLEADQIQTLLDNNMCKQLNLLFERSAGRQIRCTNEVEKIWTDTGLELSCLLNGPAALYAGSIQLLGNINKYAKSDVRNWFSGMELQLKKAIDNMMQIVSVAKSEEEVKLMCMHGGVKKDLDILPFYISSQNEPVAWSVRGKKC